MSYDQAMRLYGIDKPDMRLPAMVDVREALTAEELAGVCGEVSACAKSCRFK